MASAQPSPPILTLIFAAVAGFAVSFTAFLVLTLNIPIIGYLLLGVPPPEEGGMDISEKTAGLQEATEAMGSFWWWMAVVLFSTAVTFLYLQHERHVAR
jgi:hypothetical protein